ncbi:hypothetical protein RJZ56_007623 [Blastomyces dermatitidis]|uniref:Uncharacterized protein n=2 Tax=Blastomyces TaxID=229219 RepID=A0A179UB79_BLAGS|nr:uncharacterized protein BDBG_00863 [Blastomyces gilchristii SLH14081]EGE82262.1 hypothetical protein BDDG_05205 [Blastomyces dermatitidis ATCC 18188]OAT04271.1 hypothetical protein BDBG_00863 [Blastomyces gilchristii SLH14081]
MSSYFFSPQQHHHAASQHQALHHHQQQQQQQQQHQQQQQQHPPPPTSHTAASASNAHHGSGGGGRRRGPKMSGHNNPQRQFRGVKSMRELAEAPAITAFRARFEAGRSFDLDDDLEFCPGLLTEDDLQSIHSYASDRSSLASISPDSSPLQHQIQPAQQVTPSISLSPASLNKSSVFSSAFGNSLHHMKLHQPSAVRTRNAIPIVNPSTGMRVSSPPGSQPRW